MLLGGITRRIKQSKDRFVIKRLQREHKQIIALADILLKKDVSIYEIEETLTKLKPLLLNHLHYEDVSLYPQIRKLEVSIGQSEANFFESQGLTYSVQHFFAQNEYLELSPTLQRQKFRLFAERLIERINKEERLYYPLYLRQDKLKLG